VTDITQICVCRGTPTGQWLAKNPIALKIPGHGERKPQELLEQMRWLGRCSQRRL